MLTKTQIKAIKAEVDDTNLHPLIDELGKNGWVMVQSLSDAEWIQGQCPEGTSIVYDGTVSGPYWRLEIG